jgi:hypothetical protein
MCVESEIYFVGNTLLGGGMGGCMDGGVEGGLNIVGSSLNGSPAIVEGGLNEVRSISATSEILIINGGN